MGSPAYLACSLVHRGNRTVRKRNMDCDICQQYLWYLCDYWDICQRYLWYLCDYCDICPPRQPDGEKEKDGLWWIEILRQSSQKNYLTCFDSKSPASQGMKYTWRLVLLSRKFHVHISLHLGFPECLWCQPIYSCGLQCRENDDRDYDLVSKIFNSS